MFGVLVVVLTPLVVESSVYRLLLVFLFALAGASVHASLMGASHFLDGSEPQVVLDAGMEFFRDTTASMSLSDVLALEAGSFRQAQRSADLHLGYTSDVLWLRQTFQAKAGAPLKWLWVFETPYLDRITLYVAAGDEWIELNSGATLPVAERAIAHRQSVFPVRLEADAPVTVYARIRAKGSMSLSSSLWMPDHFYRESEHISMLLALYFGTLLALGLYNFLLFLGTGRVVFLLYSAFVLSFSVGVLALNGIGQLFLWPNLGPEGNRVLPFGFTLAIAFAAFFARRFLRTYAHSPRWDRALWLFGIAVGIAALLALWIPTGIALRVLSIAGLLTTLLLFSCGVYCAYHRVVGARIFVLAWLLLLLGSTLLSLRNLGILPTNALTIYSIQIGSALEMLLLSFGLASRFNQLKKQKEAAQMAVVTALRAQEERLEREVQERTEALASANRLLTHQATHDSLTGLVNRNGLFQQLEMSLSRINRQGGALAVLLLDLDGFKPINDQFGHDAGDRVLTEVASRLRDCARETDVIARLGGDEFVVVAEFIGTDEGAEVLAERILLALQQPLVLNGAVTVTVGASIGVALTRQRCASEVLLKLADEAMYDSKRNGKGLVRVMLWPPALKENTPSG